MLVEMKGIVVDFGPVRAVDHVDFTVKPGEIVGLMGENGAGKSTLMNVLAGTFPPNEGEILLDGKRVSLGSAKDAMRLGIRFIHQELNLCDDLTVFENMYLAEELLRGPLLDKKAMAGHCAKVFERMQVEIDPWAAVETLQPAEKQMVEIARALLFKSEVIIMDEPTTALSTHEIENLFEIMRQLKAQGVSFVYISHKMPELFEICETYSVLRDGKLVSSGRFSDIDESAVTEMMIGRTLSGEDFEHKPCYARDEVALSVKNLTGAGFRNVSFDLRKGEIIAITGLQGSGRDQLADALFGAEPSTGEVTVNGHPVKSGGTVLQHMHRGIGMVPRSRKERGILNDLSIIDNTSMAYFNTKHRKLLIRPKDEVSRYEREKKALSIKADNPKNPITSLSGGNQQKVILGRWLETDADILIFDNPTQGIDVGTKFEIYHLILRLAESGKAILVFSSEFPEIFKLADKCMVMYLGEVRQTLDRAELTEKNMMYYAIGANLEGIRHG